MLGQKILSSQIIKSFLFLKTRIFWEVNKKKAGYISVKHFLLEALP
jgi:hypothetical protein